MNKGKYLISMSIWKQTGKSRRKARILEEREGYIDTENNIAYTINDFGDCRITDINTGLSIYSCYAKTIDDCIRDYKNVVTEIIKQARSKYYYENSVKLFEYLKTCKEPVTEQKLAKIFN